MSDKTEKAKDLLIGGSEECKFCRHHKFEYHDNTQANGPFCSYYSPYCDANQDIKHEGNCGMLWLGRDD